MGCFAFRDARSPLQNLIFGEIHRLCSARYGAGYDIVSGSADEDQEWWISCNGLFGPFFAPRYENGFFEHFWNPDEPNFPGKGSYDKGLSNVAEPSGIFDGKQFASSYNKAKFFWDKKVICYYTGRDNKGNTCERSLYSANTPGINSWKFTTSCHSHHVYNSGNRNMSIFT